MRETAEEAAKTAVYAFTGQAETIEFTCEKSMLDDVIDRFGTEITVMDIEDRYRVHATAAPKGVKFWALQYLPHIEVKKPEWLRLEIIESINKNTYGGLFSEHEL